jgi:dihydroneopterin aldolase
MEMALRVTSKTSDSEDIDEFLKAYKKNIDEIIDEIIKEDRELLERLTCDLISRAFKTNIERL